MRACGILMPVFSLPGPFGIGTLGKEAFSFVDFLARAKQTYWQILPIGPTGYGDSPYQSFSAFAGNPYFIDFRVLHEQGYLTADEIPAEVPVGPVDYGVLYQQRPVVLQKAADRLLAAASAEYKETYTKAGRAKKEYDAVRAACEAEAQEAKPEREKAAAEAAKLRALVDPALLKRYDAIHANHARPMATVENSQCSGCRMSLPTAIVKKVASGSGIVECENCGRILYSK